MKQPLLHLAAILSLPVLAHAQCFEANFGVLMPRAAAPATPGIGDDVLFDLQPMADGVGGGVASFPMGGIAAAYTHAHVQSNGVVFLTTGAASGATTTGYSTSASTMVNNLRGTAGQPPRIAAYWRDLNILAANGAGVYFNNTIPGKFVVTWRNAVHFGQSAPVFTLQAQLHDDGHVDLYYSGTTQNIAVCPIAGISAGNAIADPGASNLSAGASSATQIMYETFATANTFDLANTTITFSPNAGGGYDETVSSCILANNSSYGSGCYNASGTWYENFAANTFDLVGTAVHMTPNGSGGYTMSPGTPTAFAHTVPGLGLTDDSVAYFPLPATFNYPGGSTTTIGICSNGYIWMQTPNAQADFSPTVAELFSGASRLCPAWVDALPDGATNTNNVFAEADAVTGKVYVTWVGVPTFGAGGVVDMQVELDPATGEVNYTYGAAMALPSTSIIGWAPGTGLSTIDPGNRDVSATLAAGFTTVGPEVFALAISASPAPVLGSTLNWTIANIPATAVFTVHVLSFGQNNPGIELGSLGAPGCYQLVDPNLGACTLLVGSPTANCSFSLPNFAPYAGAELFAQAVAFDASVNALGVLTSNAVRSYCNSF